MARDPWLTLRRMIAVRRLTVDEAEPHISRLVPRYAEECAMPEIGDANPEWSLYRHLEANGALVCLGAFGDEGTMIGFLNMLVTVLPHYGKRVATSESFFVHPEHRDTGAGLQLLAIAEDFARQAGAVALLVSAPYGTALARVAPRRGYRRTNTVHAKRLH